MLYLLRLKLSGKLQKQENNSKIEEIRKRDDHVDRSPLRSQICTQFVLLISRKFDKQLDTYDFNQKEILQTEIKKANGRGVPFLGEDKVVLISSSINCVS